MSAAVQALLQRLTIPEKVEILQILLDALPDDVMWPGWLEDAGQGCVDDHTDELKLREDAQSIHWPKDVSADPDHYLNKLSLSELALLTETLWAEVADELPTPDWMIEEVRERKRRIDSGEEELLDWEDVKRDLRQECP